MKRLTVLVFAVATVVPSIAWAGTSVYSMLLDDVIKAIGTAVGAALLAVLLRALKRLGIATSDAQAKQYEEIIGKGISFAEEMAHQAENAPKGADKLALCTKFIIDHARAAKLPEKTEAWIRDRIHASLHEARERSY